MDVERTLIKSFERDASRMTPRALDLGSVISAGRRRRTLRRIALPVTAAACVATITLLAAQLWSDADPRGRTIPPASGLQATAALEPEAEVALKRFVGDLVASDHQASWDALSPRARDVVGSFARWKDEARDLASFLEWVDDPRVQVVLTRIPASSEATYVATALMPSDAERPFLQPVPLVHEAGRFQIDLTASELSREVSLEPITPVFYAAGCPAQGDCEVPEPPEVVRGMTFSVTLDPATAVKKAWFSIGSEWTAEADPLSSRGLVNEYATFEPEDVEPGVKVFLVTIETRDGKLVNYGYRVTYKG